MGECRKGIFNLSNAREKAVKLLFQIANNEFVSKRGKGISLKEANEQYLSHISKRLAPATIKKEQGSFGKYLLATLGSKGINELCKFYMPCHNPTALNIAMTWEEVCLRILAFWVFMLVDCFSVVSQ